MMTSVDLGGFFSQEKIPAVMQHVSAFAFPIQQDLMEPI